MNQVTLQRWAARATGGLLTLAAAFAILALLIRVTPQLLSDETPAVIFTFSAYAAGELQGLAGLVYPKRGGLLLVILELAALAAFVVFRWLGSPRSAFAASAGAAMAAGYLLVGHAYLRFQTRYWPEDPHLAGFLILAGVALADLILVSSVEVEDDDDRSPADLSLPHPRVQIDHDAPAIKRKRPRAAPARRALAPSEPPPDPRDPWGVRLADFPRYRHTVTKLRFCLRYAILAPSSHNTQPWRFVSAGDTIELLADRTRALPVADPDDRELVISCGAALHHLRLAMRCFGIPETTEILPDPAQPDLLARVVARGPRPQPTELDHRLLAAIVTRRTNRRAFDSRAVAPAVVQALAAAARAEGAEAAFTADEGIRRSIAAMVAEADLVQLHDKRFRRELAAWMHHSRTRSRDGIPGYAFGISEIESIAAPAVVRTFDLGNGRAARDQSLAAHSPVLGVLGGRTDDPPGWLAVGQALSAVALTATAANVAHAYLNQAVEVPEVRERLRRALPAVEHPHLVLRFGFASPVRRTPRRPLDEVLIRG